MSLDSTVTVVLGATGGIATELCRRIAARGGKLVLCARDESRLAATAREFEAVAITGDATDPNTAERAVAAAVERFGRIDAAVNCVGSILLKPAHLTSIDEWRQTIATNLDSSFYLVRAAAKAMTAPGAQGGSIVLCSSAVARHGYANHEAIAAAKAGIIGLMLAAAATYAPKGIRLNCVAPGLTNTPLAARLVANEASLKASLAMHADGRLGEPADVASAIEWLIDPANRHVTGQVLAIDGGLGSLRAR